MEKSKFAEIFIEGVQNSVAANNSPDWKQAAFNLACIVHKEREQVKKLQDKIADMDEIAVLSDTVLTAKCRACGIVYDIPCDLSEFNLNMSYCGGSPRCCP